MRQFITMGTRDRKLYCCALFGAKDLRCKIMPPKLSKADRERLKREEAERKAREEEERRAREEEEEKERQEKERIEREEAARKKALQDARIAEDTLKVRTFEAEWQEHLETWKNDQAAKKEWDHYLSCSQLPLVTDERALNSWISEYRDAALSDIATTLEDIKNCLTLCREVERVMEGDGVPAAQADQRGYYQNTIQLMRSVVLTKLSLLTHKCSLNADSHLSSETYNMTLEVSIPGKMALCLWGNVTKNPRLKDFSFKERSFSLELPKPLILADVVVSVLYPPFDHLTPLARSYTLKTNKADGEDEEVRVADGPENGGGGEEGDGEAAEVGEGTVEGEGENEAEVPAEPETNGTEETAEDNKGEEEVKEETKDEVEIEGVKDSEEDEVDLRRYRPAGGPIVLTLLELPSSSKTVGQWTIRRIVPEGPQTFVYPQELSRPTQQVPSDQSGESVEGGGVTTPPAIVPGCAQWPPVKITTSLPTPFHFEGEPLLAQWDNELNIWRTGRVKDVEFDMVDNSVTFETYHFSPLAIMTDQYANMPYKSWELGLNHTKLTLAGALVKVVIGIKERECTLLEPSEEPSVAHLLGQPMTAPQLLTGLENCGINFYPKPDGHKYCSIPEKSAQFEASIYQHIAMAAASYKFSSSRWNSQSGPSQYILQCAKVDKDSQASSHLYACGERTWRLVLTEESSEFAADIAEDCEPHSDIYSTLMAENSSERLPSSSPPHMDTLLYWLSHSRPLTYTSPS